MKFCILIFNFVFCILNFNFIFISPACAWQLPIEVATLKDNGNKVYNKLVVGIEPDATDGFDSLWDTPAMLSHPDPENQPILSAYFTPNVTPSPLTGEGQGGGGEAEMGRLWKDIRGPVKGTITWNITVDSVPPGKAVVISWNTPQGLLKAGERLVLRDNDNVDTDITQASNYVFVSDGEEPRSLALVLSMESSNTSRSGGGSGFGCGTIKLHDNRPSGGGTAVLGIIALFSPLVLRLFRNRSS